MVDRQGQHSFSISGTSSGPGTSAEGNLADLMMSSAELLSAVKAAGSRCMQQWDEFVNDPITT